MPPGKLAAQAGHAYLGAFLNADEITASRYASDPPGTKVCLGARDLSELLALRDYAASLGLPHALVVDSGHVYYPDFDGSPIVTALGVGPATREEVANLTKRLSPI